MALSAGTRLGPFEILSALGAGGMGEVYRARDTKLNRNIAIKVLPDVFANDPERLARFHREAQVLAALNHPNIAHIHGFQDADGIHALVMELVDGPTLAERIAQGPIPLAEALAIAKQIAEALEAAHEQGIIHRDLKPANVKLREDGTVKVLDFGLARLVAPESSGVGAASVDAVSYFDHASGDARGRDSRHCGLHEPRAGERPRGGQAERRMGVRRRPLRDADGTSSVRGRRSLGHAGGCAEKRAGLEPAAGGRSSAHPDIDPTMSREGSPPTSGRHFRRAVRDRRGRESRACCCCDGRRDGTALDHRCGAAC